MNAPPLSPGFALALIGTFKSPSFEPPESIVSLTRVR